MSVMVRNPRSDWDHKLSKNHHWYYIGIFVLYLITILAYLVSCHSFEESLSSAHYMVIGYILYAFLEYLYHRFDLHQNMMVTKQFKAADLHHCFPNLPELLSITMGTVNPFLIFLAIPSYFLLEPVKIAMLMAGLILGVISYNFLHYMCHLGPDTNISWLK